MRILTMDSSTPACTVALSQDGEVLELFETGDNLHSTRMLPMIHQVLSEASLKPGDLDCIGVGIGPGSFTGLRIGVGIGQGLAASAGIPVVAISSLAVLAQGQTAPLLLTGFDARMGEIYWACFERNSSTEPVMLISAEQVSKPEDIVLPQSGKWMAVGTAWKTYADALSSGLQKGITIAPGIQYPHAADIVALAEKSFAGGKAINAEQLVPSYVRNDVAKKAVRQ